MKSLFLDIPHAAREAGISLRRFRRLIERDGVRIVQIGRKFFLLRADFERWRKAAA